MAETLKKGADSWLRIFAEDEDGAPINGATVRLLSLTSPTGVVVPLPQTPLELPYVSGSAGEYRVLLPRTLAVESGTTYTARAEIDGGAGLYTPLDEFIVVIP